MVLKLGGGSNNQKYWDRVLRKDVSLDGKQDKQWKCPVKSHIMLFAKQLSTNGLENNKSCSLIVFLGEKGGHNGNDSGKKISTGK